MFLFVVFSYGKSKDQQGASSDSGARSEASGSSKRVFDDQGIDLCFKMAKIYCILRIYREPLYSGHLEDYKPFNAIASVLPV